MKTLVERLPVPGRLAFVSSLMGVLLAVAAGCARPSSQEAGPWVGDPSAGPAIDEVIRLVWNDTECVSAREASAVLPEMLADRGHAAWVVSWAPGVRGSSCVGATVDSATREIILNQALRPEVTVALEGVADELLRNCLTEEQASEVISSTLRELGETGWELRSDGPLGGPIDRIDEVRRHVDAGCFICSGTGLTPEGHRLYFVGGR